MTAFTSVGGEPERTLRNLGEPWEPLRSRTGIGDSVGDVYGPAGPGRWEGAATPGGRTCTDLTGDVYVPPQERRAGPGQQRMRGARSPPPGPEGRAAEYRGKVEGRMPS